MNPQVCTSVYIDIGITAEHIFLRYPNARTSTTRVNLSFVWLSLCNINFVIAEQARLVEFRALSEASTIFIFFSELSGKTVYSPQRSRLKTTLNEHAMSRPRCLPTYYTYSR